MSDSSSQYPSPDSIDASFTQRVAADQQRHADFVVMSNRQFLGNILLLVMVLVLVVKDLAFHANFRPAVSYVQFEGGRPVVFKPDSSVIMDSLEYHPYRLRAVVKDFITRRYAYDYRNLPLVLDGMRLMTEEGRRVEVEKVRSLDLNANVTQRRLHVQVDLDESAMQVVAQAKGRFRVTVPARVTLLYEDGTPAAGRPIARDATFDLTVVAVRESVFPLGYLVDATGENRIW